MGIFTTIREKYGLKDTNSAVENLKAKYPDWSEDKIKSLIYGTTKRYKDGMSERQIARWVKQNFDLKLKKV